MKRKYVAVLLLLVFVLGFFAGCKKVSSTREVTLKVTIVDTKHKSSYMTPIKVGKVTTYTTHPAKWYTYVEYNGVKYNINNKQVYNFCKEKVGEQVFANFKEIKYDDESISYSLLDIVLD